MHDPKLFRMCVAAALVPGFLRADSPDAVVTFNEIHYNPPLTQDAESLGSVLAS